MSASHTDPDDVTLIVGDRRWQGWQDIRITLGIERCPNDFDLVVTERFPGAADIVLNPGDAFQLWIGDDLVVTGYIDRYSAAIAPGTHKIGISGRGKCQDLTDCHIIADGQTTTQIGNAYLLRTAQALAQPYGITVAAPSGDAFIAEEFSVFLTETPYEVIERLCRATGYLVYEFNDGTLVLDRVGDEEHATGFVQGVNVEKADVSFSMDQRFSEYRAVRTALENFNDVASRTGNRDWNSYAFVYDRTVPRRRRRTIVVEQQFAGDEFAIRRANWEMARRYGRSQAVTVQVDSWRDGEGRLWQPNRLARLHLPALKLEERKWLIGEVTFRRGREGEHAEVLLMPREAFLPQPIIIVPFDNQVSVAVRQGSPDAAPAPYPTSGASGGTP